MCHPVKDSCTHISKTPQIQGLEQIYVDWTSQRRDSMEGGPAPGVWTSNDTDGPMVAEQGSKVHGHSDFVPG